MSILMNFTNAFVVARTDWTKLNTVIEETKDEKKDEAVLYQEIEVTKMNSSPLGESSDKTEDTSIVKQASVPVK